MTGYVLLDRPNPAAPDRGDGRYWGYATMLNRPRAVVVHTAESVADELDEDLGAEAIARYFATSTRPASYHSVVDSDSTVRCLPAGLDAMAVHTAFHAVGANSWSLGASIAMRADSWGTVSSAWTARALNRLVNEVAAWCARWDIPPVRITMADAEAGGSGILGHADVDPTTRTDPGAGFPWDRFLALVAAQLDLGPSTNPENVMTPAQENKLDRVLEVSNQIADGQVAGAVVTQLDARLNNLLAKLDAIEVRLGAIEAGEMPTPDELVVAAARRIALGAPQ